MTVTNVRPNPATTATTTALITSMVVFFFVDPKSFSDTITSAFAWSARYFGAYWQALMMVNLVIGGLLAIHPSGRERLGALDAPEFNDIKWGAMILCTLLAGGGVFWASAEPIAHYLSPPPLFHDVPASSAEAVPMALSQSFLHWGFLAWSILGSVGAAVLLRLHHEHELPLAPRTLLFPLLGRRGVAGWPGDLADITSTLAVFAGTVGPIGFLGLQLGYGAQELFGASNIAQIELLAIAAVTVVVVASAASGLHRGIQLLSTLNIGLGTLLLGILLVLGPYEFVVDSFGSAVKHHLFNFFDMATFRGGAGWFNDPGWLGYWTVFFWGWFIGYGPMMAIFIARVSRGRTRVRLF